MRAARHVNGWHLKLSMCQAASDGNTCRHACRHVDLVSMSSLQQCCTGLWSWQLSSCWPLGAEGLAGMHAGLPAHCWPLAGCRALAAQDRPDCRSLCHDRSLSQAGTRLMTCKTAARHFSSHKRRRPTAAVQQAITTQLVITCGCGSCLWNSQSALTIDFVLGSCASKHIACVPYPKP